MQASLFVVLLMLLCGACAQTFVPLVPDSTNTTTLQGAFFPNGTLSAFGQSMTFYTTVKNVKNGQGISVYPSFLPSLFHDIFASQNLALSPPPFPLPSFLRQFFHSSPTTSVFYISLIYFIYLNSLSNTYGGMISNVTLFFKKGGMASAADHDSTVSASCSSYSCYSFLYPFILSLVRLVHLYSILFFFDYKATSE